MIVIKSALLHAYKLPTELPAMSRSAWLLLALFLGLEYVDASKEEQDRRHLRYVDLVEPYRRHRVHTEARNPQMRSIDLEAALQGTLPGFSFSGDGNKNTESESTSNSEGSSSSNIEIVDVTPDYLQKWGDYVNQVEDTSQYIARDVKNYQMSVLDKVSAAAHDFFASDSEHTRDSFIDYLQHALHLSEEERISVSIAADQYLENHQDHKNAITVGEEEASRGRSITVSS